MFQSSSSKALNKQSSLHQQQLKLATYNNYETLLKGVETIKDYAIFVLNKEGLILTWNKGAEAIKGYQAEEIIGQSFTKFYKSEAIAARFPEYELEVAKAQGRFEDEGWRIRKDGTSFWANVIITAIYNENEHIGFVKVTRDLTERKLAEEKIKTLEKGIESVKDYAIFLLDKEGNISSWNKGAEIIKGYRAEEIIGQSIMKFYPAKAIEEKFPEYALEKAKEEGNFENEGWRIRKDGTAFWADVVITAIYNEQKEHVGFVKVTRDLTERKQAERELAKSERDYRTLASIAPVGIFHCTPQGYLTYANEQACQLMGLSLEEALGEGWLNAIYPEDRQTVMIKWDASLKAKKTFILEYRFYHRGKDKIIWVINQARPELDEKEEVKSYVQTITNINKRKMLEQKEHERLAALETIKETQRKMLEEAENNQKRLKEFIDTVCHEIRNPLNGMAGSAEMLNETIAQLKSLLKEHSKTLSFETGSGLTSALESLIDIYQSLNQSVLQQKLIVDDVLDASRLEHNQLELKLAPFSPKGVILDSVQIFTAQFKQKGIQLELKLPDEEAIVEGDAVRLKQVLINLISNALKFTLTGNIEVGLTEYYLNENTIELAIEVKDTGIGMDEEEVSHMFKRFTQFASSSSSSSKYPHIQCKSEGSGLGLSISQKLIEIMRGNIEVKSKKGIGTQISIKVPMSLSVIQKLGEPCAPQQELLSIATLEKVCKKALIVEDNPINQKVLIHYLKQLGWEFQIAENGLEALCFSQESTFDVIFMDIEMPVMDGLSATKHIRQHERSLGVSPVIIIGVSANAQIEQIESAKEAGMNDYITKPIHKATLVKLLQKLFPRTRRTETFLYQHVSSSSSFQNLSTPHLSFFQPRVLAQHQLKELALQFKAAAQELLSQQFPFNARCENECITIELSSLTPYLRKCVLFQFRQLVEHILQKKIVRMNMTDNYLQLITSTSEAALTLKTILSEAGFAEAFNRAWVEIPQAETQPQSFHTSG